MEARLIPAVGSVSFRALYERRLGHEPGVAPFLLERAPYYDAVLEVGANVGLYTILFSKCLATQPAGAAPQHRVFSFEPGHKAFTLLQRHLALNRCTNVQAFNAAVASRSGPVEFHENSLDWMKGSSQADVASLFPGTSTVTTVPAVTGSQIAPMLQPYTRPLFKIDVVGGEADVLMGLQGLILETKADIVLGVWQQNREALNRLEFLRDCYDLSKITTGRLVARKAFTDDSYCNYFLGHRSRGTAQQRVGH